ncbi:MAG: hypothetical protein RIS70_2479 [Planctomycetota bacterium]|jgi:hypothetical protein
MALSGRHLGGESLSPNALRTSGTAFLSFFALFDLLSEKGAKKFFTPDV